MSTTPHVTPPRSYAARGPLLLAGVAFVAYPALRPYGPETGQQGAADLGSTLWLVSHSLGMVGFVALALGLRAAVAHTPWHWSGTSLPATETRAWLAVAFLLPYYGAETFALNEMARHATATGQWEAMEVVEAFRYAPLAMTVFGIGLLMLLLVAGRLVMGLWHAGTPARTGALLAAVGLATYLPQFFGTPEVRIIHGLVLAAGLATLALTGLTSRRHHQRSS